jgi:broad specificity phosphatase PhoE
MKLNNRYFIARHGHATSNGNGFYSSYPEKRIVKLTSKGKEEIKKNSQYFKKIGIDLIFSSDLLRTKQTAEIISKITKISIIFDKRLREIDFGNFNGLSIQKISSYFKSRKEKFTKKHPNGENYNEVQKRMLNFFGEINKKYKNKNILIVSHGGPLWLLESGIKKLNQEETILAYKNMLRTGKYREIKL